jgi:DNA repair protein RadC
MPNPQTDTELLALALNIPETQWTQHITLQTLRDADDAALYSVGLNEQQLGRVQALLELARRLNALPAQQSPMIRRVEDALVLLKDMEHLRQEHVRVLLLDNKRRLMNIRTIYIGTLNGSMLRVAEVYREAIAINAPALILAHNHPSGDPSPSPEDVSLTHTLIQAGQLLDITLLDHLIIGRESWRSLRQMGLGFD